MTMKIAVAPLVLLLIAASGSAQTPLRSAPQAVPIVQTVPDARDVPYPGVLALDIDASDTARGIFRVTETIPVAAGTQDLILLLPEWIPGHHAPRGTMAELVDIHFFADGRELTWRRDPVEVFAFHVDVPAGAKAVVAKFLHTSPLQPSEGRITVTRDLLNLQWDRMSLYPAGHYVRQIRVQPSVTFPQGWTAYTALDGGVTSGSKVGWAETDYETLVDSPIFAGKYARRWDLGQGVSLDAVAEKPEQLELPMQGLAKLKAMVDEELLGFGGRHWDHYEFLVALSDRIGGIGLEHQRSSENQIEPENFTNWDAYDWDRNVLPHELAHSWVGKFRRPARLWTPDFRQPMQGNLLWVYEGLSQFWGYVHAVRSGVQSKDVVLGTIAAAAGLFTQQPGRAWRSVSDTTQDPVFAARKPKPFASLARGEDYYNEGMLVWLEADQLIRKGTAGARGLEDFTRAFFGIRNGDNGQVAFEFDDVVKGLNAVYPYDWSGFLHDRIDRPGRPVPLAGIEMAGYRLVWKERPNPYEQGRNANAGSLSLYHSLGVTLDREGRVTSTRWDSPAFNAGIVTGSRIVAVGGEALNADVIRKALTDAKTSTAPIQLLVQRGDRYDTVPVDYHDGLRYPWLERAPGLREPAGLDLLFAPRRTEGLPFARSRAK